MSGINEWLGPSFPGAVTSLDTDVDAGDCAGFDTFEALVTKLQVTDHTPTTIRFGRAFTEDTVGDIATFCGI